LFLFFRNGENKKREPEKEIKSEIIQKYMKERNENISKQLEEIEQLKHQEFLRKLEKDIDIICDNNGRFIWFDKKKKEIIRWNTFANDKFDPSLFPIFHIPNLEFPEKKVGFFQSLFSSKIEYKEFFRGNNIFFFFCF
jgi:hypothetical protein